MLKYIVINTKDCKKLLLNHHIECYTGQFIVIDNREIKESKSPKNDKITKMRF